MSAPDTGTIRFQVALSVGTANVIRFPSEAGQAQSDTGFYRWFGCSACVNCRFGTMGPSRLALDSVCKVEINRLQRSICILL